MKIADIPTIERPREKLIAKGAGNLKIEELLAILFRSGRKGMSALDIGEDISAKYSLQSLSEVAYPELTEIDGMDISKCCTLLAAIELGKRMSAPVDPFIQTVFAVSDAIPLLSSIRDQKKEHFVVLYMNARQEVIHQETVSIGTLNQSLAHPREIFEPAVKHLASVIMLAHNHPSGSEEPSDADVLITKRLVEVGVLMGIEVMDHIIITRDRYYSFREHNMI